MGYEAVNRQAAQQALKDWRVDFWAGYPEGKQPKWLTYLRWHLECLLGLPRARRVLDIGAGPMLATMERYGLLGAVLEALVGSNGEYVGLDPVTQVTPDPRVSYIKGWGEEIVVHGFDAVLILATLDHAEDPAQVLAAAREALTPTGRIHLAQWTKATPDSPTPADHLHSWTEPQLRALISGAGLTISRVQTSGVLSGLLYLSVGAVK